MPNCSNSSKPCNSKDNSKPKASRRLAGAMVAGTRGPAVGIAMSVDMLSSVKAGNIVEVL